MLKKMRSARMIDACYSDSTDEKPFLFGIGRTYPHAKACFYFLAWMIRDAPQQRLSPLISRMQKADNVSKMTAETDSFVELIFEYRTIVKSFDWQTVREVVLDRLEGSRRSIGGHRVESPSKTSLITALQYYYSIHGNYGQYRKVEIANKQIKIGNHTVDVSVGSNFTKGRQRQNQVIDSSQDQGNRRRWSLAPVFPRYLLLPSAISIEMQITTT